MAPDTSHYARTSRQLKDGVTTLVTGVPRNRQLSSGIIAILVNALLVVMVLDLTYGPHVLARADDLRFARVGFVSHTSAALLVRDRSRDSYPLKFYVREKITNHTSPLHNAWSEVETVQTPNSSSDFTARLEARNLRSDSVYEYRFSNGLAGTFQTPIVPGVSSDSSSFTFLHSSCMMPNFPYLPLRDRLAIPGLGHLANTLPRLRAQFMLFLGDFIYADVPRQFGTTKEDYRVKYRQVYASPDWQRVTQGPPWLHVYDDHEIANDWDKNVSGVYANAVDPFMHYQASVNPTPVRPGATYFSFTQGPASFFLLDTRRYRSPADATDGKWAGGNGTKSMLGSVQRDDLLAWLARREAGVQWKIVVSSVPFTKNWQYGSHDSWGAYLGERYCILQAMWAAASGHGDASVVVLSGDRHEFAATAFPPPTRGADAHRWPQSSSVYEFSASPLSMFYLPVRTYQQVDDEDVRIAYIPDGNSKFGAVKLTPASQGSPARLDYELYIDGSLAWNYTVKKSPSGPEQR